MRKKRGSKTQLLLFTLRVFNLIIDASSRGIFPIGKTKQGKGHDRRVYEESNQKKKVPKKCKVILKIIISKKWKTSHEGSIISH